MNGGNRMDRKELQVQGYRQAHGEARMVVGQRDTIREMLASGEVRAIGKFRDLGQGAAALPVVYVSKRNKPWYARRWVHITSIVVGLLLLLASLVAWTIISIGIEWFIVGLVAIAIFVVWLVRFSRGGGSRGQYVDVTTSTRVRVRR